MENSSDFLFDIRGEKVSNVLSNCLPFQFDYEQKTLKDIENKQSTIKISIASQVSHHKKI